MLIRFNLQDFSPIEEGERVLKITKAECRPAGKPSKAEVTFTEPSTGKTLRSNYNFDNQYGLMAFGFLCRTALNLPDLGEFDTNDIGKLVNKTLLCEIAQTQGTQPREDGSLATFANIKKVIRLIDENEATQPVQTFATPRASIKTGFDDLD